MIGSTVGDVRVAIVDDDTVIRDGLPHLLTDLQFVGSFESVSAFLQARPVVDVVLLDLSFSGLGGRHARKQGAAAVSEAVVAGYSVLIYTNEPRRDVLAGCLSRGARGAVAKAEPIDVLERAIRAVAAGDVVLTQAMIGLAEIAERRGEMDGLTLRQRQILSARARGEPFSSIGRRLFISPRTAEDHWSQVASKFADYLVDHSPADLERKLGLGPGDLLDEE